MNRRACRAARAGSPARDDEVVHLNGTASNRAGLAESGEVIPMALLRCHSRGRAAIRKAPLGSQMTRRVLLDADQQVESSIADGSDERFVDQRMNRRERIGIAIAGQP